MKSIRKYFKKVYRDTIHSIAFYPVLIGFCFFLFSIVIPSLEDTEAVKTLKEKIPNLFIQDYETARSILATLIGGILSLTVFSFTMVMLVLSQASSNFSPRLLPGLISNKQHQIILGVYIGTLLYCIIIMISLGAYGVDSNAMALSTMVAAIMGVGCIGFFVYFIHSISRAIQIHNIIERIFRLSQSNLKREGKTDDSFANIIEQPDTSSWTSVKLDRSGYYRGFDPGLMEDGLKNKKCGIEVVPYEDQHLWEGEEVLRIDWEATDEEKDAMLFCMDISSDRHEGESGLVGMIKLMEVAVKALSPGINDPGTAINAISKLALLIERTLKLSPFEIKSPAESQMSLIQNRIGAGELMRIVIQPIRQYAKEDIAVTYELVRALKFILESGEIHQDRKLFVRKEMAAIKEDLETNIPNIIDRERILKIIQ